MDKERRRIRIERGGMTKRKRDGKGGMRLGARHIMRKRQREREEKGERDGSD